MMMYAKEMASGGMIYMPRFMTTGSGIQVILKSLPHRFERLQCPYNYGWDLRSMSLK
jgi:hypothetical protein